MPVFDWFCFVNSIRLMFNYLMRKVELKSTVYEAPTLRVLYLQTRPLLETYSIEQAEIYGDGEDFA